MSRPPAGRRASQRPAAPRTSPGPGGSGVHPSPRPTPAAEAKATAWAAAPWTASARLARKASTVPEVSATCSASGSRRTISWASAAPAAPSSAGPVRSPGSPVSTRYVAIPEARRRRRPASAAPSSRRRARYRAGGQWGSRPRSGGHQRRRAKPVWVSKKVVPAAGSAELPPSWAPRWASKVPRPSSVRSTPWQYWSTRFGVSIISGGSLCGRVASPHVLTGEPRARLLPQLLEGPPIWIPAIRVHSYGPVVTLAANSPSNSSWSVRPAFSAACFATS